MVELIQVSSEISQKTGKVLANGRIPFFANNKGIDYFGWKCFVLAKAVCEKFFQEFHFNHMF